MTRIYFLLLLLVPSFVFSQMNNDSLWSVYTAKSQSLKNKLSALDDLSWNFIGNDPDSAYYFSQLMYDLAFKHPSEKEKIRWQSKALNNFGITYENKGDYPNALQQQFKSLRLKEQLRDNKETAITYIYIGNIYYSLGDYPKSLKYYKEALQLFKILKDEEGIAGTFLNISSVYLDQKDYTKALNYQMKSLEIFEKIKDKRGLAYAYGNIGHIYENLSKDDKAIYYLQKSLDLNLELGEKIGEGFSYANMGLVYLKQKKYELALNNCLKSEAICQEIGDVENEKSVQESLYRIYQALNKSDKALEHYERFVLLKDSLFKEENQRKIIQNEMNFEFEKKQAIATAKQDKKDALTEKEKQKQNFILSVVLFGLILVILVSMFLFNRFKVTKRQKTTIEIQKKLVDEKNNELNLQYEEIEHQKRIIEEHQQEIIDSINYAKHIQDAILPPVDLIQEKLPDTFVYYKPKDIVAGDFYWMEEINDTILIAAADCTGHGVPGAMVSVVCSNALNRAVKEFQLMDPGKILDKVIELVVETFEKSASEVQDGMDISLLSINKITKEIKWSGANNPLWYFEEGVFREIGADKQPVGKNDHHKSFTTHLIEYKPKSIFYLFTDGFADQFGGPKGKKFKYKQLEEVLSNLSDQHIDSQHSGLNLIFEDWKGNLEQVDDVCIIGIRV